MNTQEQVPPPTSGSAEGSGGEAEITVGLISKSLLALAAVSDKGRFKDETMDQLIVRLLGYGLRVYPAVMEDGQVHIESVVRGIKRKVRLQLPRETLVGMTHRQFDTEVAALVKRAGAAESARKVRSLPSRFRCSKALKSEIEEFSRRFASGVVTTAINWLIILGGEVDRLSQERATMYREGSPEPIFLD